MQIATAYQSVGHGDCVVLVHGLGEDLRSWRYQQRAFASTCQTVAYDVRGHGLTPIGDATGTLAQLGEDLVALTEDLNAAPVRIIGYSLGGTIAMWVAANHPDLVSGIAVVASSSVVGRRAAEAYMASVELMRTGDDDAIRADFVEHTRFGVHRSDVDIDSIVDYSLDATGEGDGYCNASLAMARLNAEPLHPEVQRIECETLVIGGQYDEFCPRKAQDMIVESISSARYVEIPDVGHFINDEDSVAFTAALAPFVGME